MTFWNFYWFLFGLLFLFLGKSLDKPYHWLTYFCTIILLLFMVAVGIIFGR